MISGMIGDFLGYFGRLHPLGQHFVDIGLGRQSVKDFRFVPFSVSLGQPADGMAGKRQVNRCGGLLHHG